MNPSRMKCLTPADIEALLTEQPVGQTRHELEEHLASCRRCWQELEAQRDFETLRRDFAAVGEGGPPGVRGHIVHRLLGRGGWGEVWLAYYPPIDQWRALKVLRADRFDPAALADLRREAKVMARLKPHRNRVQVFDLIEQDGTAVLAMAYVEGGPLNRLGRLSWERAVRYVADAADGLVEVHEAGLLHRDIKPGNLLWDRQRDAALVADYGLAAHAAGPQSLGGTLGYAAPEVREGRATARSDVYALAATLHCLLTGRPPSRPEDLASALAAVGCPRGVAEAIRKGLEPDAEGRPTLDEFRALLRRVHVWELAEALRQQLRREAAAVGLRVTVSTADPVERVFRTALSRSSTDEGPEPVVRVRTGDLVRIEAVGEVDGYLTLLNFGSSGNLGVLPGPETKAEGTKAGDAKRLILRMTPPAGSDRLAVVWTRTACARRPEEWRDRIGRGGAEGKEPSRDVEDVLCETDELSASAWTAVFWTVCHA